MSLNGKVIVVTGGGSGIGAAAALHFASEGARVVISGRRLDALVAVAAKNKNILAVQGDAAVDADLERLKSETLKAFGHIDGVFLNAGYEGAGKRLADTTAAELAQVFVVNNVGPILGIKHFADELAKTSGAFIITSSGVAEFTPVSTPAESIGPYVASKAGADHIVRAFNVPLQQKRVRIVSVNPAVYSSEMSEKVIGMQELAAMGIKSDSQFAFMLNPLGNLGNAIDVAKVAGAVFSGESKYESGHNALVFPSRVAGEPLTEDSQHFHNHISDASPFQASYATAEWKDFRGVRLDEIKLFETRLEIAKHAAVVKAATEQQK